MKRVTQLLKEGGKFTAMPKAFTSFFQIAISVYIARVLGPKTPKQLPSDAPISSAEVGCGECRNCEELHDFVNGSNKQPFRVCDVKKIRSHIEWEISRARIGDIVSTTTIVDTRPYTLVVTKLPEIVARMEWSTTQSKARAYVESFGFSEEKLKAVMGDRYEDMLSALQGRQAFLMEDGPSAPEEAPNGTRSMSPFSMAGVLVSGKALAPPKDVAGLKRKFTGDIN
jgi:hypothetical protein